MSLSRTLSRLKRGQQAFAAAFPATPGPVASGSGRLQPLGSAFANPGNLNALAFVPEGETPPAGLIVVLHGCTQQAEQYDRGAGWSRLAERNGVALLYPEQRRENNHNLCFNWYQAADAARGQGEAASIAALVEAFQRTHAIGPERTFVTGLSAGGAMAAVMLATYPELFAGGAIIAGLPFGCARNLAEAFECMGGRLPQAPGLLADKVRAASPHEGPWPRLSVWHGGADRIVSPANTDALVAQWTGLHGLTLVPDRTESIAGHTRRVWLSPDGIEVIEHYHVAGMGHGTPLLPGIEAGQSGQAGAHMLDVGLSSTDRIAAFFGLAPTLPAGSRARTKPAEPEAQKGKVQPRPARRKAAPAAPPKAQPGTAQAVIENALRAAGLLR